MKKVFSAIVLVSALFVASSSQAQSFKFGVKGGYNITDMKIDKNSTSSKLLKMGKENKNGWFIGPTAKISIAGGLGADGAIFYDQRETELGDKKTVKQQFINVPINLRYNLGLGSIVGVYVAAGAQVGFNVGDTDFSWDNFVNDVISEGVSQFTNQPATTSSTLATAQNTFQLKKSAFSVNLGAGVTLLKHLEVGFAYNIPLGNTADLEQKYNNVVDGAQQAIKDATSDVKSHTWQVSAAYYF